LLEIGPESDGMVGRESAESIPVGKVGYDSGASILIGIPSEVAVGSGSNSDGESWEELSSLVNPGGGSGSIVPKSPDEKSAVPPISSGSLSEGSSGFWLFGTLVMIELQELSSVCTF
jgi:hypothetical protein